MGGHTTHYLSAREVADRLGVSELTVRRAISSGELRAVRLGHGRAVRVDERDLARALRPVHDHGPPEAA
jgi:excisionase family DNA binding protein